MPACDGQTPSQPPSQPRRRSKYPLCISASRSKKYSCKSVVPMESVNSTRYQQPHRGTPNTKNWVPDIHLIHHVWRRKIRWIQRRNYFSNPTKVAETSPENPVQSRSSQTKSTGMHRTAVVYNRSLRSWWKTHNCVGSRVCRREKFRKFNVGGARLKTAVLRYYAHGKKF